MQDFWKTKSLEELDDAEWEAICDGCGRCCLQKLECADSGEIFYTGLACGLLDLGDCRCSDYENRLNRVEDCVDLRSLQDHEWAFMPSTCAYRLLFEGKALPDWHPLVAGHSRHMQALGIKVGDRVIHDHAVDVEDYQDYVIKWVDC